MSVMSYMHIDCRSSQIMSISVSRMFAVMSFSPCGPRTFCGRRPCPLRARLICALSRWATFWPSHRYPRFRTHHTAWISTCCLCSSLSSCRGFCFCCDSGSRYPSDGSFHSSGSSTCSCCVFCASAISTLSATVAIWSVYELLIPLPSPLVAATLSAIAGPIHDKTRLRYQ